MIQFTPKKLLQPNQLVVYPGYGYQTATGTWKLRITGVVASFPDEYSFRKRMMLKMLGNVMRVKPEQLDCDIFKARVAPFLADGQKREQIKVQIGEYTVPLKKQTKSDGQFKAWISISDDDVKRLATKNPNGTRTIPILVNSSGVIGDPVHTTIFLQNKNGVSVVSDIDDTIKVSGVGDRRELLANTFLREFRGVDGMADVYRAWYQNGASFHYVSSSPWQLFGPLLDMKTAAGFPAGTVHLRSFRLHDQLLRKIHLRQQGKSKAIRSLMKEMPKRQFVLVGDSGEKDPEIYYKLCKKHPDRIKGLFIRELESKPIIDDRMQKLQTALPNGIVAKFFNADQLAKSARSVFTN